MARSEWTGHSTTGTISFVPRAKWPITSRRTVRVEHERRLLAEAPRHAVGARGHADRRQHARRVLPHRAAQQHVERRRLAPQLLGIGDVLPGAAAAGGSVTAAGRDAVGRGLLDRDDLAQYAAADRPQPLHAHALAGDPPRHEQALVADIGDGRAGAVHAGKRHRLVPRGARGAYPRAVHAARLRSIWLAWPSRCLA